MLRNSMLLIANWKMHGDPARIHAWADVVSPVAEAAGPALRTVWCPPSLWLSEAQKALPSHTAIALGGQDCRAEAEGPYTGDISARMLEKAGARYVIIGHSERRTGHGETSEDVAAKCQAAKHAGLIPIICIGETWAEREAGNTLAVVREQLAQSIAGGAGEIVIAYEPVWAIGTGKTPTLEDIAQVHRAIAEWVSTQQQSRDSAVSVVYGGSVNPSNAASILAIPEVHGALIGSASLQAESFVAMLEASGRMKS